MPKNVKIQILYFVGLFWLFTGTGLGFFKYKRRSLSIDELTSMMLATSESRSVTENLCSRGIFGDPLNVGENYVKISFDCGDKQVISSMSVINIKNMTIENVLEEYFRIVNYRLDKWNLVEWNCMVGKKKLEAGDVIGKTNTIICKKI